MREEELPSPDELMPLSQTLITPHLALAFNIPNPNPSTTPPPPPPPAAMTPQPNNSADSSDLACGDEPARTLKRPRLVWTPQLHKRFVDAVAHLGIKNAVPKTIMQLMSVDGLTRENVASHLQKYRLYLKRMQGLSSGGGGGGGAGLGSTDPATEHLFATSPVPAHFLKPDRGNSDHFLPFVPVSALQHHHHHQQIAVAAAVVGHPQLQGHYPRQMPHFGSQPNGHFEHPFVSNVLRMGGSVNGSVPGFVEDLEPANGNGGRKVLTLFPTGVDRIG